MLQRSITFLEFVYGQNVMDGLSLVLAHALFVSQVESVQNRNAHKPVQAAAYTRFFTKFKISNMHVVGI